MYVVLRMRSKRVHFFSVLTATILCLGGRNFALADEPANPAPAPAPEAPAPAEPPAADDTASVPPAPVDAPVAPAAAEPAAPSADGAESGMGDMGDLESLLGEAVVTTASRSAERASVAPSTVYSITANEIMSSGMRTLDEALEFLGLGIYVAKPRDYATGVDVGAQGLMFRDAGRHVLVMLDGQILNSQGTGRVSIHEAVGVPLELIDHVEVMLGPGSVMYGSNAMLAVINVVTKRARDFDGLHASAEIGGSPAQDASGTPTTAAGTHPGLRYRAALGGGHRFRLGGMDGEIVGMVEWAHEMSSTYGITPFTMGMADDQSFLPGQTSWGGNASQRMYAPNGVITARLGEFRLQANAFFYQRGMPLVASFNDSFAREQQNGVRIDLSNSHAISSKFTLDSRLYFGHHEFTERSAYGEAFWCVDGQPNGCTLTSTARSRWIGLEERLSGDWFEDGKFVTTLGIDARPRFFSDAPATYRDLQTGALSPTVPVPSASNTSFIGAVFAQQVWHALDWLAFNVGGRLDADSNFGARLSPRAAVVLSPTDNTNIRMSYSEAFRAPSAYELSEFDPTYRLTPISLKPEIVRSGEIEVMTRISRLTASLRGYYSLYSDLIEARPSTMQEFAAVAAGRLSSAADPSVFIVNDNIGKLKVIGGSASLQARLPAGFMVAGTFNLARATDGDGVLYDRLPAWFGNLRAGWQSGEDGYSIMLSSVYSAKRRVLQSANPTDFVIGNRLDFRLSVAGPIRAVDGLRWRLAAGVEVNPYIPYAVAIHTDTPSTYVLHPDAPRMFLFGGLQYQFAGL